MHSSMSELSGKHVLITGASSGIGRVTAEVLASRGAKVWLACRDLEKSRPVLRAIAERGGQAELVELDLSNLDSVRACAAEVLSRGEPLHVLINNAGVAGRKGLTKQGFELTFGVNHLGHFLLTELLVPKLLDQPHSRVVNVASKAHYQARGIDFDELRRPGKGLGALHAYEVSKLANVLHAKGLAERYGARGLHAYSLHPGVVASDIWRQVPQPFRWLMLRRMLSNEEGARTTLYCATSSEVAGQSGRYYDDCREKEPSTAAQDPALREQLWIRSLEWAL
jgi:NAD(P)-dependent dehydrogenase (short-subunit alcohol dehydrogenase family)